MSILFNRVTLSAMAILPAAGLVFLAPMRMPALTTAPGDVLAAGAAGLLSFAAVALSSRLQAARLTRTSQSLRLTRSIAPHRTGMTLPDAADIRARIAPLLAAPYAPGTAGAEPETLDHALAHCLHKVLATWDTDFTQATESDLQELYLFVELMLADPGEAGRLANCFVKPEDMLAIKDQLDQIAKDRSKFERQRNTFEATRALWQTHRSGALDLLETLERMPIPDTDLWHHLIATFDPQEDGQRRAALWCVRQSACDKATVALFLRRMINQGHVLAAARRGDMGLYWSVERIIGLWNAGWYCASELRLATDDTLAEKERFNAALDAITAYMGAQRPAVPVGIFEPFAGRAPGARDSWCLSSGTLRTAPRIEDYISAAA